MRRSERTDSTLIWDLAVEHPIGQKLVLYGRIENLTDEQDIVGRQPYGARPNKDRTLAVGLRFAF